MPATSLAKGATSNLRPPQKAQRSSVSRLAPEGKSAKDTIPKPLEASSLRIVNPSSHPQSPRPRAEALRAPSSQPRPRAEVLRGPSAAKAQGRGAEGPQQPRPRAEALRAPSPEGQGPRPRGPAISHSSIKMGPPKGAPKGGSESNPILPPPQGLSSRRFGQDR